jgi:hypothetical protein
MLRGLEASKKIIIVRNEDKRKELKNE